MNETESIRFPNHWERQYKTIRLLSILFICIILGACANKGINPIKPMPRSDDFRYQPKSKNFRPIDISNKIERNHLQQKIDHLLILVDESQSMNQIYKKQSRKNYLKQTLQNFQNSIPQPLKFGQSILMFGNSDKQNIHTLPNLSSALSQAHKMLAQTTGNSAILVLSDWQNINQAAENKVNQLFHHNAELCIHMVGIGNIHKNAKFKDFSYCGIAISANRLIKPEKMANFVEDVFFSGPADKDFDGIYDYKDQCPGTPINTPINWLGCPRNSHQSNPRYLIQHKTSPYNTNPKSDNLHE